MMTIFERLLQGETVSFTDPDYQEILKAYAENEPLLLKANQSEDIKEVIRRPLYALPVGVILS